MKLSATDLDISVISVLDGEVKGSGAVTVAAKRFQEIVRELAGDDVEIEVDGTKISVTCSRSNFQDDGDGEGPVPQDGRPGEEGQGDHRRPRRWRR